MPYLPEHPAITHRRAVALILHYRKGNAAELATLLEEVYVDEGKLVPYTLISLLQVFESAFARYPSAAVNETLEAMMLDLTKAESNERQ